MFVRHGILCIGFSWIALQLLRELKMVGQSPLGMTRAMSANQ
jgi:hypothetical protein